MNDQQTSGMSKKAAIAGMAITSIGASNDLKAQVCIAIVAIVAIAVQGFLDYKGKKDPVE